jgi:hypothetical protein
VRTPEVVAAVTYPAGPLLYRADLATRLVADAEDLADAVLGAAGGGDASVYEARIAAWRAVGELLRDVFDAGLVHADLNMRNILVQRGAHGVVAHLLDLDRAVVEDAAAGDAVRGRMLARLHRSRAKLEAEYGVQVSAQELAAFQEAVSG